MLSIEKLKDRFRQKKDQILADYFEFLRFKSIATDSAYANEVEDCAVWVNDYLNKIGLTSEIWKTAGAPVVFASDLRAGPQCETVLLYGHYDVQPVDPIELWTHPPFEPTLQGDTVYARGALDDKGQCFYTICAIQALLDELGQLPVNLKFLIEGEEESGSASLPKVLEEKAQILKADHILIVDSGFFEIEKPVIALGVRGMTAMTITLTGSKFDLHSGVLGGMVYNPNRALVELLASMHDKENSISIPGFYDDVVAISSREKNELDFQFDLEKFESLFGFKATGMERNVPPIEATLLRPTLEITGISGGYAGEGLKTIIPSKAIAKISCRLVPDQDPDRIASLLESYIYDHIPEGIDVDIHRHPGKGRPIRCSSKSRTAQVMVESYSQVFQRPCHQMIMGGSIPIAADLAAHVGGDVAFVGVGLPDDKIHAPDEHFDMDRFEKGYLTICRCLELLGEK